MLTATKNELDLMVEFGGVSIGQETARLGLKVSRDNIELEDADHAFCGRRLTGKIVLGKDDPDQTTMFESSQKMVEAVFDVKRYGVSSEWVSTGLTFNLKDVDIETLSKFSKGTGRLVVNDIGEIPADVVDEHDEETRLVPGTLKSEGPWKSVSLDGIFEGSILKSLKAEGLATVGDLSDYTASDKRLTDIKGIGQGKADLIDDRMMQFWSDNPQYAEER